MDWRLITRESPDFSHGECQLGAALMIISIFIMEIDFKGLKERIHKNRLGETHCTGEKE
ncbi:MAG TPA: hypothetical protein GXX53_00600 [Tissierellia bacterium]|nr:hypothetical protein [Tissierellia bacterium]